MLTSAYLAPALFGKNVENSEKTIQEGIADAEIRKGLKLLWFATGSDDFLLKQSRSTVDLFKKNGTNPVYRETSGGHTWINWQLYLNEFAPQLFRD
jgi:enterochelin esterase family protein